MSVSEDVIMKTFEADFEWFSESYDELVDRYRGKVIAIRNKQVICYAEDMLELVEKLRKKGEDPANVFVTAIPSAGVSFIL